MHINLLPLPTWRRIQARALLRSWIGIWLFCGCCLGLVIAWKLVLLHAARERVGALAGRCRPLYSLLRETEGLELDLVALHAERDALIRLKPRNQVLPLLGVLTRTVRPTAGQLQVQRLSLVVPPRQAPATKTAGSRAASGRPSAAPTPPRGTLAVHGIAVDDANVAQFVDRLRASGLFERVELKVSTQQGGERSDFRAYQLECRYEVPP